MANAFFQKLGSIGDDPNSASDGPELEMKAKAAWNSFSSAAASAAKSAKSASMSAAKKAAQRAKAAGIDVPDGIVPQNDAASDEENLVGNVLGSDAQQAAEEIRGLCPALTYKQRLYGALSCVGLGFLMSIGATLALLGGKNHISDYAVLYTLGNIFSICGSGFIVGPCRQAKLMFKPVRRAACIIYLSTMIATVFVAIYYPDILLIFTLLIIQYCALIWYGASFIRCICSCI